MVTGQGCSEIDKLLAGIGLITEVVGDPVGDLARTIQQTIQSEADPYILAGVLIEGAVQTLARRIPAERRAATRAALLRLVADRLRASSSDDPPPG